MQHRDMGVEAMGERLILACPARVAAAMAAELGVDAHRLQTMMDLRRRERLAARHDVRVQVS